MTLDCTVAIPTYNGELRLPQVLERLQAQVQVEDIAWEIIVVDNNSGDRTADVVKAYQSTWSQKFPLRYVFESEQGAAFARQRAIREAQGEIVAFLDDDNIPAADWLAAIYRFGQRYPQAGAFSGRIQGKLEIEPPEGFDKIQAFLAIRDHGSHPLIFDAKNLRLPPGASLAVRKSAWQKNVPLRPTLTGKLPGLLVQGDDYEPLLYLYKAGWEIWYNPNMQTQHLITKNRLQKDYLLTLAYGCGLATYQLRIINANNWQKPLLFIKTLLGNFRRILIHFFKYRNQFNHNLATEVEMAFYKGSFNSPFYSLRLYLKNRNCR